MKRGLGGLLRRLGGTRAFSWAGVHVLFPLERFLHRTTGRSWGPHDIPSLWLTTHGRVSGKPRSVRLAYLENAGRVVVVASNWGQQSHPAWSENLLAHPECEVEMGGRRRRFMARVAGDDEKRNLWPRLLEVWPGWQSYTERTSRDFRVFLLEPASAET